MTNEQLSRLETDFYSATITLVTSGAFSKLSFSLNERNGSCGADQGPTGVKHFTGCHLKAVPFAFSCSTELATKVNCT